MSIAHRIALDLEREIRSDRLGPGTRLKETEIAEQYGVSRGPVREALRTLAANHWITLEAGRGARVAHIHDQQNLDAIEVSGVLFGLTCRIATTRLSEEQVEEFFALVSAIARSGDGCSEAAQFLEAARNAWFFLVDAIRSPLIAQYFHRTLGGALLSEGLKSFEPEEAREKLVNEWKNLAVALKVRDQARAESIGRRIPLISLDVLLLGEFTPDHPNR